MGAGIGSNVAYGVPINPRVDFAKSISKKENKLMRIDAPALVNLPHTTLRYRYKGSEKSGQVPKEKPYEGTELGNKYHYFFHHKKNVDSEPEQQWKHCYVYKGPERARQKHIYYVFGKGLKMNENGFLEANYKPEEQSFERPIFYKTHGHIYLDIIVLRKEKMESDSSTEKLGDGFELLAVDPPDQENNSDNPELEPQDMEMCIPVGVQVLDIQVKLARKFVKLAAHIHLYLHGVELRSNQKLKNLTSVDKTQTDIMVLLHPK